MPEPVATSVEELKSFLRREAERAVRPDSSQQPHLKLRQLEILRAAAKHENFSRTASALGITRAAVSDTILQLEHALGDVALFERDRTGGDLTASGKAVAIKAQQLLDDEDATRAAITARPRDAAAPERVEHLSLRHVEVFVEATRHETFGATARALGVSRAYVSDAIAALEHDLGDVRLFERDTTGAMLTHAGKVLATQGKRLLQDEEEARGAVATPAAHQSVSARHHRNAEAMLAAVEFIEQRASTGAEVRFSESLTRELKASLPDLAASGESVERVTLILDLMQASVMGHDDIAAMLEPGGRASEVFRQHHAASEQRPGTVTRQARRGR